MSFNHQWHRHEVANLWPSGSVVLLRIKFKSNTHHAYTYVLIMNWVPDKQYWDPLTTEYQLIEEPRKQ